MIFKGIHCFESAHLSMVHSLVSICGAIMAIEVCFKCVYINMPRVSCKILLTVHPTLVVFNTMKTFACIVTCMDW